MKRPRRIAAGLAAVLLLSLTACGGDDKSVNADADAAQTFGVAVQVQRVAAESIATDDKVSGRVLAEDEATIMVGIAAKCVAVYKDAGDDVREGEILCTLDLASTLSQYNASQISYESAIRQYNDQKAILDQQVEIAEKGVTTAEQQIAVQKQQIAAQEESIAAQEANLPVTERQIANAEANLPVTERQIANAEANLPVTEQQIANAEAGLPIQEQQLEAAEEQFAVQEANIPVQEQQLALAESQLALAKKNVSDTEALFRIGAASQMEVDNAKMSADQLQYQCDQLRVALSNAEAQLSLSKAQIASQKTGLENTRTQIEAQKVGLESARTQIEAQKAGLKQTRAAIEAARVQVEQLRLALSQAESQLASARLGVEQAKSARSSTLAQMEAGIESARASVQQMNSTLADVDDDGNVIAPISGTLVTFNAVENSYISNAMPVAVIHGENDMKVTASVSEALVPKLAIGDGADIYVSALKRSMKAVIRSVERAANAQTRLYTVTLALDEPAADLLAGMFADVTFHTDRVENAIVIPSDAILTSGETQYVYIAIGDTAKRVEVQTGLTGTGVTEILSGLDGGEYLITVGQTYVSDGADIRIVGEK